MESKKLTCLVMESGIPGITEICGRCSEVLDPNKHYVSPAGGLYCDKECYEATGE